jgi:molybdate transport system substrate-binding protein
MFRRLLLSVGLLGATLSLASAQPSLTVFAAASMQEAMEKIGVAFEEETGVNVVFSFAGTGTLARQVEAGAPADLFVAADTAWMDYVEERGAVQADTITKVASNALVLIGPENSRKHDLAEIDLAGLLSDGRLAIAEPETVPAGRYGKAALEQLSLWQSVAGHLAPMENVRIVLTSVARGDVPVGLVYQTDALVEPGVAVIAEIPSASHPEIQYLAAVTGIRSKPAAADLLNYLTSPRSREILRSYGFVTDKVD